MEFVTIAKQPKDKIQVCNGNKRVLGYLDYSIHLQKYLFVPLFDEKFTADELITIGNKLAETA